MKRRDRSMPKDEKPGARVHTLSGPFPDDIHQFMIPLPLPEDVRSNALWEREGDWNKNRRGETYRRSIAAITIRGSIQARAATLLSPSRVASAESLPRFQV